jgi:hypothetical protein
MVQKLRKNRDIQELSIAFWMFSGRISMAISCARTAHCCQELIEFAQLQTNFDVRRSDGRNVMKTPWKTPWKTCRDIVLVQPNTQASDHPMKPKRRTEQPDGT